MRVTHHERQPQSSREQRSVTRRISAQLEQAGIPAARRKVEILMQLRAPADRAPFMPLLQHPESDLILNTAQNIGALNESGSVMLEARLQADLETVLVLFQSQIKRGTHLICPLFNATHAA